MSWRDAPLYVETHDLARWLLERMAGRERSGGLGQRIEATCCALVEAVALALTFPLPRPSHLADADAAIVRLRCQLRLARELGLLSAGGHRFATGRLRAAGRMIGGWRKRMSASPRRAGRHDGGESIDSRERTEVLTTG